MKLLNNSRPPSLCVSVCWCSVAYVNVSFFYFVMQIKRCQNHKISVKFLWLSNIFSLAFGKSKEESHEWGHIFLLLLLLSMKNKLLLITYTWSSTFIKCQMKYLQCMLESEKPKHDSRNCNFANTCVNTFVVWALQVRFTLV